MLFKIILNNNACIVFFSNPTINVHINSMYRFPKSHFKNILYSSFSFALRSTGTLFVQKLLQDNFKYLLRLCIQVNGSIHQLYIVVYCKWRFPALEFFLLKEPFPFLLVLMSQYEQFLFKNVDFQMSNLDICI